MFLIYRINEVFEDRSTIAVQPEEAIFDVFYRFSPEELHLIGGSSSFTDYIVDEDFMDCGDWFKGYTTYYNRKTREKHLIINIKFEHTNPTIIKLIRDYKINIIN